jgi:uncharacterized SAM-binding protein YcdF (DUF218 family)
MGYPSRFATGRVSMSLDVLIVLVVLALVAHRWRRRRLARALGVLAAALFLAVGCGPLPAWLLTRLQAPYVADAPIHWAPRNAIVLLGAGTLRIADERKVETGMFGWGRIARAAELYRACKASGNDCKLEVSGGDAVGTGAPEATIYGNDLLSLGVEPQDMILEPRSMNTWQNAQFSAPLLKRYGADQVLLVSSGTHLRRGSLYFAHFGIDAIPVRADYLKARWSWWPQSWNFMVADMALHEYVGVAQYHLYNALGWNVQATRPGAL